MPCSLFQVCLSAEQVNADLQNVSSKRVTFYVFTAKIVLTIVSRYNLEYYIETIVHLFSTTFTIKGLK